MVVKCFLILIFYCTKMNIFCFWCKYEISNLFDSFRKKHSDKILILLNSQNLAINIIKRNFDVKISIFASN